MSSFSRSTPSQEVLRGVHRLAVVHSHAWAYECSEDEMAADFGECFLLAIERMEASEHRPVGLYPSLSHVTGTGRLSWEVALDGRGIELRVDRPAGGVVSGQGRYTVAVGHVDWDGGGNLTVSLLVDARPEVGVHLRHVAVMEEAVAAAIGSYETSIEAERGALDRVRMHAGDWRCDQYFGGTAAELASRLDVESAALDAARALALASPPGYQTGRSYFDGFAAGEPVAVGVAGWEPDTSTLPWPSVEREPDPSIVP